MLVLGSLCRWLVLLPFGRYLKRAFNAVPCSCGKAVCGTFASFSLTQLHHGENHFQNVLFDDFHFSTVLLSFALLFSIYLVHSCSQAAFQTSLNSTLLPFFVCFLFHSIFTTCIHTGCFCGGYAAAGAAAMRDMLLCEWWMLRMTLLRMVDFPSALFLQLSSHLSI